MITTAISSDALINRLRLLANTIGQTHAKRFTPGAPQLGDDWRSPRSLWPHLYRD